MTTQKPESGDSRRDEVIAGEYVLGVLSAEDRRKAEARMATDRNFAAMVVRWQNNLAAFGGAYEPDAPRRRFGSAGRGAFEAGRDANGPRGAWGSLPLWRSIALASLSAVVVMAGAMAGFFSDRRGGAPLVASLVSHGNADLVAHYEPGTGRLRLSPVAAGQTEEKSLELWLINDDDPPVSLGVLPPSGEGEIVLEPGLRRQIATGSKLSVSVEPLGGSTTGSPTGAVIAQGTARGI
ncbi:anti-sigma factor [Mesorhizobium plurifarium]|uniref:anti-sigma factor n=1 Tax=Sinorhizobium arboris TaxID=76745 RepID=UPI0003F6F1A7|nr:anti-sigma factor [Sinorhizobium arboris]PST27112.1 anti-sigma factor [Mesorhizobium plurifarium]